MLKGEHSAILLTFIKLPFSIKIFVLSILVAVLHRFYCNVRITFVVSKTPPKDKIDRYNIFTSKLIVEL